MFLPALGGSSAELMKCIALAIACTFWFKKDQSWHDRRIPLLGMLMLGILLWASLTSPVTTLFESMVGGEQRLDGCFSIFLMFLFAWYCFWDVDTSFDEDGEEHTRSMYWYFGMTLSLFVIGCAAFRVVYGWNQLALYVGKPLGISGYMALTIPFIVAWIIKREKSAHWSDIVLGVMAIIAGVYLSAETGYRSSFVGLIIGSLTALLLLTDKKRIVKIALVGMSMILLAITLATIHPYTRDRFAKIGFSGLGEGPRGILAKQAWQHGFYPLGWGVDSQKYLIDRGFDWNEDLLQVGRYDRFHAWPIEITVTAGWVGLIVCLIALFWLGKVVLKRFNEWWICGFAGMIVAFLVCSTWNPPTKQQLLLVALATSGICVTPKIFAPKVINSFMLFDLDELKPWLVRFVTASLAILFISLSVGDRINRWAKRDWVDATGLPHEILARQAWAVELYPWCSRDRVMFYYLANKTGIMTEPNGNRMMLCQLLRLERRQYGLEAALWIRLKNYEKANQKIMMAQADVKIGKKMFEWGLE